MTVFCFASSLRPLPQKVDNDKFTVISSHTVYTVYSLHIQHTISGPILHIIMRKKMTQEIIFQWAVCTPEQIDKNVSQTKFVTEYGTEK